MPFRIFCALCGGGFRPNDDANNPNHAWALKVRLLLKVCGPWDHEAESEPQPSGLGIVDDASGSIVAPTDYHTSLAPSGDYQIIVHDPDAILESTRKFVLHEFCWQLLLSRIAALRGGPPGPIQVARWLFHILHSVSWADAGGLMPQNRYYGGIDMRHSESEEPLFSDPDQAGTPFLIGDLGPRPKQERLMIRPNERSNDPFTKIPVEIIHEIFTHLHVKDICAARLSSRPLARVSHPDDLPQAFWASRFSVDHEMGFMVGTSWLDLDPRLIDWAGTYFEFKQLLQRDSNPHWRNRRRIWRSLEDFAGILASVLAFSDTDSLSRSSLAHSRDLSASYSRGQFIGCPSLPYGMRYRDGLLTMSVGTRSRQFHCVKFVAGHTIQISTKQLGSGTYISGFRVTSQTDNARKRLVFEAGLLVPSNLTSLEFPPNSTLYAIDVCISSSGIHGLLFHSLKPNGEIHTQTVGDVNDTSGFPHPVARLTSRSSIAGLRFGFDIYKAVYIQVMEPEAASEPRKPARIWQFRSLIEERKMLQQLQDKPNPLSRFHVDIFAPLRGVSVPESSSLCRMTLFSDEKPRFYGLLFAYSDGTEVLYGHRNSFTRKGVMEPCIEQSFMINGEAGERINHVDTSSGQEPGYDGNPFIHNVAVWTNFGRKYLFGPATDDKLDEKPHVHVQGYEVEALLLSTTPPLSAFAEIGIMGGVSPQNQVPRDILTESPTCKPATPYRMRLGNGFACFSRASLHGIKRIRVSRGMKCRSRGENVISGVILEYHGGQESAALGQWMEEAGDISLEPQERLTQISIWVTTVKKNARFSELMQAGQVVGMSFTTSSDRRLEVQPARTGTCREGLICFRSTPYEELEDISWRFGMKSDDIKVSLHGRATTDIGSLCPTDGAKEASNNPKIYSAHRGLLLFQEPNAKLLTISVSANKSNKIIGFRFIYSTKTVNHGTQGSHPEFLDLKSDETVSGVVIYHNQSGFPGIEFRTSKGRKITAGKDPNPQWATAHTLTASTPSRSIDIPDLNDDQVFYDNSPIIGIWVLLGLQSKTFLNDFEMVDMGPVHKGATRT